MNPKWAKRARMRACTAFVMGSTLVLAACGGGGDGGSGPQPNRPPVIDRTRTIVLSNLLVLKPQDVVAFDVRALDPDVEPVTYTWSLSPDTGTGSFSDPNVRDPRWTVGNFRGDVTVTCVASDGEASDTWSRVFSVGTEIAATQITDAVTWTKSGGPYVLTGNINVTGTGSLTVEPGTRIYRRPQAGPGGTFTLHALNVAGTVTFGAEGAETVLYAGGLLESVRPDQHNGIVFSGAGTGTFLATRLEQGTSAILHTGTGTVTIGSQSLLIRNTENGVLMSAGVGGQLVIRDTRISNSANGVATTSGSTLLERVNFTSNGVALSAAASVTATNCSFGNSSTHHLAVRVVASSPAIVQLDVSLSDFLTVTSGGPAVNIAENICGRLNLQIRGNYWGTNLTPDLILDRFARREDCNANVDQWTTVCKDASCDWSNEAFN